MTEKLLSRAELQQSCNRAATELQHLQQSCSLVESVVTDKLLSRAELQQSCNRAATTATELSRARQVCAGCTNRRATEAGIYIQPAFRLYTYSLHTGYIYTACIQAMYIAYRLYIACRQGLSDICLRVLQAIGLYAGHIQAPQIYICMQAIYRLYI